MATSLQGMLLILGIMLGSAGAIYVVWYLLFAPKPPPIKIIELSPIEFVARLRTEKPPWVSVAILDYFSLEQKRYRFRFFANGEPPALCETVVNQVRTWASDSRAEPHEVSLGLLYKKAQWHDYCTEHCGWCGTCVHTREYEGQLDNPIALIGDAPAP